MSCIGRTGCSSAVSKPRDRLSARPSMQISLAWSCQPSPGLFPFLRALELTCAARDSMSASGLNPMLDTTLWGQHVRSEYLTATAITIIAALLTLLVGPRTKSAGWIRRCPVCDRRPLGRGTYCSECGSRTI